MRIFNISTERSLQWKRHMPVKKKNLILASDKIQIVRQQNFRKGEEKQSNIFILWERGKTLKESRHDHHTHRKKNKTTNQKQKSSSKPGKVLHICYLDCGNGIMSVSCAQSH